MELLGGKNQHADERSLLVAAERDTWESTRFTYLLSRLLFPVKARPYFYCWYAYFRWLDDLADASHGPIEDKTHFLLEQAVLVARLYGNDQEHLHTPSEGERYLALLIAFDRKKGQQLKAPILGMLSCISYDVARIGSAPKREELDHFIDVEVTSYLKTILYFCCLDTTLEAFPKPYEGIAGKWSHILRDCLRDLNEGIINISQEELDQFELKLAQPETCSGEPKFQRWVASRVAHAESNFRRGKQCHHPNRCLRYKLAVAVLCVKYEYYLKCIRKDNFRLRRTYETNWIDKIILLYTLSLEVSRVTVRHLLRLFTTYRDAAEP